MIAAVLGIAGEATAARPTEGGGRDRFRAIRLKRLLALRQRSLAAGLGCLAAARVVMLAGLYLPLPAGDAVLGVASVLSVLGALVSPVPFVPFGRPEFGDLAPMPLPEFVVPGVP